MPGTRGASEVRTPRARSVGPHLRRLAVVLGAVAVLITVAVTMSGAFEHNDSFPSPNAATLAGLSVPQRVVALAQSQVGYSTQPSNSYCNKFSAYWDAGQSCGSGLSSEEWCADFAAWAWREAGVQFTYGYAPGEINGGTISFYEWAVDNGLWHPAVSGYVASPGDVAVYGITLGATPSAAHVAIVVDDPSRSGGPERRERRRGSDGLLGCRDGERPTHGAHRAGQRVKPRRLREPAVTLPSESGIGRGVASFSKSLPRRSRTGRSADRTLSERRQRS